MQGESLTNNTAIILYGDHGWDHQQFQLIPVGINGSSDLFEIAVKSRNSGNKVLDVRGGKFENGAPIILQDDRDTDSQQFHLISVKSGFFKISARSGNKVLDVQGNVFDNSTPIILFDDRGTGKTSNFS